MWQKFLPIFGLTAIFLLNKPKSIVKGGKISSPYLIYRGKRTGEAAEKYGENIYHQGIDIKAPANTPIRSVNSGIIRALWPDGKVSGYGNTILIEHNDGTGALYAHLTSWVNKLDEGDKVRKGQIIGFIGQTQAPRPEMKTAPHLHLEIIDKFTKLINPLTPRRDPIKYIRNQNMRIA